MNINMEAHIKALTDNLELINIAFIIALFADCLWITRDLINSGLPYGLLVISALLWLSLGLVGWAFIKYHMKQAESICTKSSVEVIYDSESEERELNKYYDEYSRWSKGE